MKYRNKQTLEPVEAIQYLPDVDFDGRERIREWLPNSAIDEDGVLHVGKFIQFASPTDWVVATDTGVSAYPHAEFWKQFELVI